MDGDKGIEDWKKKIFSEECLGIEENIKEGEER